MAASWVAGGLSSTGSVPRRAHTRAHGSVRGQRVLWRVMLGAKLRREASASGVNNDANKFSRIETLRLPTRVGRTLNEKPMPSANALYSVHAPHPYATLSQRAGDSQ